jgi:hypothetical protein
LTTQLLTQPKKNAEIAMLDVEAGFEFGPSRLKIVYSFLISLLRQVHKYHKHHLTKFLSPAFKIQQSFY